MNSRNYKRGLFTIALMAGAMAALLDCSTDRGASETTGEAEENAQPRQTESADAATTARARDLVTTLVERYGGHLPAGAVAAWTASDGGWRAGDFTTVAKPSAALEIGARPDEPTVVRDLASGIELRYRLLDAAPEPSPAAQVDGLLVHLAAGPAGADLIRRVAPSGIEDFFYFAARPSTESVRLSVDVSAVAGLRLVSRTLELLDAAGAPRLRVTPPYLIDADGAVHHAALELEGCRYDDSLSPPWRRAVVPPGAPSCTLVVNWQGSGVRYPALLDPVWETTQHLVAARRDHSATLLDPAAAHSLVLVAGGYDDQGDALASAELYNPLTRTFSATGPLSSARGEHSATALATVTPWGRQVLVAGGRNGSGGGAISALEIYDPDLGTFQGAGSDTARWAHTATLLPDDRVLIAGGRNPAVLTACTIFAAGTASACPSALAPGRASHTATLMSTGLVLIAGGVSSAGVALNTASLFDPSNDSHNPVVATGGKSATMGAFRMRHTAVVVPLSDPGDVLVVLSGGTNGDSEGTFWGTSDHYRDGTAPNVGFDVQSSPPEMVPPRADHSATVLPSGEIVIAGGRDGGTALAQVLLAVFDESAPLDPLSYALLDPMANTRYAHAALLVSAGVNPNPPNSTGGKGVLVMGGRGASAAIDEAEILVRRDSEPCTQDSECLSGICSDTRFPSDNPNPGPFFCCNERCDEECFSCRGALTGQGDGVCAPILNNTPLPTKCKQGGSGQGGGGQGGGTIIGEDDVEVRTACDGSGKVKVTSTVVCTPNTCKGDLTGCAVDCTSDADCSDTGWCQFDLGGQGGSGGQGGGGIGECAPKKSPGTPCDGANECAPPGLCVDGVCCNLECQGQCEACNLVGKLGSCENIGSEAVPADPVAPRTPCEGAGSDCALKCVGGPVCSWPSSAPLEPDPAECACDDSSCAETHLVCDTLGGSANEVVPCDGFRCADATSCSGECASDSDCTLDYICEGEPPACEALTEPKCDGGHILRIPAAEDQDCTPYVCDGPACLSACTSIDDCVAPAVCDDSGTCVGETTEPEVAACSCELVGAQRRGGWRWALGGLGLLLLRRRRRRSVAPSA